MSALKKAIQLCATFPMTIGALLIITTLEQCFICISANYLASPMIGAYPQFIAIPASLLFSTTLALSFLLAIVFSAARRITSGNDIYIGKEAIFEALWPTSGYVFIWLITAHTFRFSLDTLSIDPLYSIPLLSLFNTIILTTLSSIIDENTKKIGLIQHLIIFTGMTICGFLDAEHTKSLTSDILLHNITTAIKAILIIYTYTASTTKNTQTTHSHTLILVTPTWGGLFAGIASIFIKIYPPVFAVLRALTPTKYRIIEFITEGWHERYYCDNALVAITCFTSNAHRAYHIAKEFRAKGAKVVIGGPHATFHPHEALAFCDAVVTGEAEGIWEKVIHDYETGKLSGIYKATDTNNEDFYTKTHHYLMNAPGHISSAYIETTRGCKFNCDFCAIPTINERKLRHKPIELVIKHLTYLSKIGIQKVGFRDNNIFADPTYAKQLFTAMIPLGIRWSACASIDIGNDEEALRLARKSGCDELLIGYEIAPGSSLSATSGKFSMAKKYIDFSDTIRRHKIKIKAHFIFGFDEDTWRTLLGQLQFTWRIRPHLTALSLLTPLPGTPIFEKYLRDHRIASLNWTNYSMHNCIFVPLRHNKVIIDTMTSTAQLLFFLFGCNLGMMLCLCLSIITAASSTLRLLFN